VRYLLKLWQVLGFFSNSARVDQDEIGVLGHQLVLKRQGALTGLI
jgi:hypothetical protein